PWGTAPHHGCRGGARGDAHAGGETARCHPLEYARDGGPLWLEPEHGQSHLARLRPAAASHRGLQALEGPALRGEGAGYRGPVPGSPRSRLGVVRRREVANSGPGSPPAAAADAAGPSGTPHTRLHAPWHDVALRGVGCQDGDGYWSRSSTPSRRGVSEVPRRDRSSRAAGARYPPDPR